MSEKLIDTFLSEANELVVDIERALLALEEHPTNKESISAIFRAMHTLKGAAGMFGFDFVRNITHHLENIYQDVRDEKRSLDSETIRITFTTVDHLRVLLDGSSANRGSHGYDELLQSIISLAAEGSTLQTGTVHQSNETGESTYYIEFTPKKEIFHNGTNPLYLIDDLVMLGHAITLPFFVELPNLNELLPEQCYTAFEVILATDKTLDEIQSVFLFVDGDCNLEIQKIANENLIKEFSNGQHPFKSRDLRVPLGFDVIRKAIEKKHANKISEVASTAIRSKSGSVRVNADRLDELMNLVSELVTTQARLSLYSNSNSSGELSIITENIEKITRRLRDNAFTMSLVPLETIAVRFQRLVSDLSKELNKSIDFITEGMETKIDKSVIEKLTDPILHILRNCIDHGIEHPDRRISAGKQANGVVKLKSYYSGSNVFIEISDDGAGLNLERIRNKAVTRGLIGHDTALNDKELVNMIFLPGFSTAETVTGVSGRGVGMDVVHKNITEIRGEVEVVSNAGRGTTFTIKLPLTLSILDGLLVKIGMTDFILPLNAVAKCYEVPTEKLETSFNKWITLDEKRTPFIYLRDEFSITENKPVYSRIISVPFNGNHVGLAVDNIVGEYQAVLKPLGKLYADQHEFSGATILGNGSVALVIDTNKMIRKLAE
jgi:two-component system chemotaxis sensor kinase CheA